MYDLYTAKETLELGRYEGIALPKMMQILGGMDESPRNSLSVCSLYPFAGTYMYIIIPLYYYQYSLTIYST